MVSRREMVALQKLVAGTWKAVLLKERVTPGALLRETGEGDTRCFVLPIHLFA